MTLTNIFVFTCLNKNPLPNKMPLQPKKITSAVLMKKNPFFSEKERKERMVGPNRNRKSHQKGGGHITSWSDAMEGRAME